MVSRQRFADIVQDLAAWGVHGTVIKRLRDPEWSIEKSELAKKRISELKSSVSYDTMNTVSRVWNPATIFKTYEQVLEASHSSSDAWIDIWNTWEWNSWEVSIDPINAILARRWIDDPYAFLMRPENQNPSIDATSRIDGVPVVSIRNLDDRFKKLRYI